MLPRMRTITETIRLLKEQDPDTCLTETALRRMVISGELPSVVKVGSKYLINVDRLINYLNEGTAGTDSSDVSSTIRSVPL